MQDSADSHNEKFYRNYSQKFILFGTRLFAPVFVAVLQSLRTQTVFRAVFWQKSSCLCIFQQLWSVYKIILGRWILPFEVRVAVQTQWPLKCLTYSRHKTTAADNSCRHVQKETGSCFVGYDSGTTATCDCKHPFILTTRDTVCSRRAVVSHYISVRYH